MPEPISLCVAFLGAASYSAAQNALYEACKFGGKELLGQFDQNHDIEKAVIASWKTTLQSLEILGKDNADYLAIAVDLKNWSESRFKIRSDQFPHNVTTALTFGSLADLTPLVQAIVHEATTGAAYDAQNLASLNQFLPPLLFQSFALTLKQPTHDKAFRGVVNGLLWNQTETNQRLIETLGTENFAELKQQIENLDSLDLPVRIDKLLISLESSFEKLMAPLNSSVTEIQQTLTGSIRDLASTVARQSKTIDIQEQVHLGLIIALNNANQERDKARKEAAEADLKRQLEEESRIRIEETAAQQAVRIANLEHSLPFSGNPASISELLDKVFLGVKQGRYIDAVRHAYEAECLDPSNSQATFAVAYALAHRPNGNRNHDLLDVINRFERLLAHPFNETEFPYEWACLQLNLATAHRILPSGDQSQNFNRAKSACEAALAIFNSEQFPYDWANAQAVLGTIYLYTPVGFRGKNVMIAIKCFTNAQGTLTKEDFPHEWAKIQVELGVCYRNLFSGNRNENLNKAIDAFNKALEVLNKESFPEDWALVQNNLGNVYADRLEVGNVATVRAYEAALEVYTRDAFPHLWAKIVYNRGLFLAEAGRISEAIDDVSAALDTCKQLGDSHYSEEMRSILESLKSEL